MAESSKTPELTGLWPILALFLIATGYIQLNPRLDSHRPIGETSSLDVQRPQAGVRARLWQDPFSAVADGAPPLSKNRLAENAPALSAAGAKVAPAAPIVKLTQDDRDLLTIQNTLGPLLNDHRRLGEKQMPLLILPAFLGGDPYPEDVETRLRLRSAVLSALRAEQFAPNDGDRLRYFIFSNDMRDMYIPFEWFEPDPLILNPGKGTQLHVLLLWLNESAIDRDFLQFLNNLSGQLGAFFLSYPEFRPEMRVLGPSDSDALKSMVVEGVAPTKDGQIKIVQIYSSQSTADDARRDVAQPGRIADCEAAAISNVGGIPIEFVIDTDCKLARALAQELHLRDACAAKPENDVAIIAEWDTLYGRGIHQVFGEVFRRCEICNREGTQKGEPTNLHHFTYFQGVDGRLPGDKSQDRTQSDREKDLAALKEPLPGRAGGPVLAAGNSRIDYLRRMVDDLKRGKRPWKAIGVVGSDVYDKILLIRVLRYNFPGTILFTTDLDARLLDPSEFPSTHNLLIASHYGLELRRDLQRDISPFRSVYDTAQFCATLRAIWDARRLAKPMSAPPIVFEVGRAGPFPVGFRTDGGWRANTPQTVHPRYFERSLWPFQPDDDSSAVLGKAVLLTLAVVAVLFISVLVSSKPLLGLVKRISPFGIVALGALAGFAVFDHYRPEGEPLRFFDGISTWPTELLRLFAGIFAVRSIIYGWERLLENEEEVKPFFDQPAWAGATTGTRVGRWKSFGEGWSQLGFVVGPADWSQYLRLSRGGFRAKRSLILVSCYLGFCLMLFLLLDKPDRPVRGMLNDWIDFLLLPLSGIATIGLLVFVADATLLCIRFVGRLSDSASAGWSGILVREWAESLGFASIPAHEQPVRAETPHAPAATGLPADYAAAFSDEVRKAIGYLLGVKAIAALTKGVGPLIYYPAVTLALMFLSRSRVLDNWDWPAGLVITFTLGGGAVVACGMALRMAADRARQEALDGLETALHQARRKAQGEEDDPLTKAVKATIDEVKLVGEGAYSSFSENPVLRAILIPLAALAALIPLLSQLGVNIAL